MLIILCSYNYTCIPFVLIIKVIYTEQTNNVTNKFLVFLVLTFVLLVYFGICTQCSNLLLMNVVMGTLLKMESRSLVNTLDSPSQFQP